MPRCSKPRRAPRPVRTDSARTRAGVVLLALGAWAACGEASSGGGPALASGELTSAPEPAGDTDPRFGEAAALLEQGLVDVAETLLDQLSAGGATADPRAAVLDGLLRARIHLMRGDPVGAMGRIERLRASAPADDRVLAGEVEVLVILERLDGARERLREAYKQVGKTAALERVRGLCLLRSPGGGRQGLEALEAALAMDPALPFTDFPLGQACILVGRADLAEEAPEQALLRARRAQTLLPDSLDALELEAEAWASLGEFSEALVLYDRLAEAGRELGSTRAMLHRQNATRLLLERRKEEAIEAYARARQLGLDDEGLGFGVHLLEEAAEARLEEGIDHFEGGALEAAREAFEGVLGLDPEHLEARHHLGATCFRLGEYLAAAEAWEAVLGQAQGAGLELPDPVHLNLAKAWRQAGDPERARAVLSGYLDAQPGGEGTWSEATRELLMQLEAEALESPRR